MHTLENNVLQAHNKSHDLTAKGCAAVTKVAILTHVLQRLFVFLWKLCVLFRSMTR